MACFQDTRTGELPRADRWPLDVSVAGPAATMVTPPTDHPAAEAGVERAVRPLRYSHLRLGLQPEDPDQHIAPDAGLEGEMHGDTMCAERQDR